MLLIVLVIFGTIGFFWARIHIDEFKAARRPGPRRPARPHASTSAASRVWQAGDWLLRFVAIWFFLDAFGIHQSIRNVLLVQVTQSLATLVPISPGGIGTEQAFIVYVFKGTVRRRSCSRSRSA